MTVSNPLSNQDRLDSLNASGLMGSEREAVFDRAIALAGRLLKTRINLVSLVDKDRQFFKAEAGMVGWAAEDRGTPNSHSFCRHVVETGREFIVSDARTDSRVKDNPAIEDLNVVAYLGIPIADANGAVLGSFCAIETEPRQWTDEEIGTLRDIAAGVQSEIRLRIEMDQCHRARSEARRNHDLLSAIVESTRDGVTMLDHEWRVIYTNESARSLMRLDRSIEGEIIWDVFEDAEGNLFWQSYHEAMQSGLPQTVEAYYPGFDAWFEARSYPRDGMLTVFFRDVTAQRKMSDARQVLVRELDHRIKNIFSIVSAMTAMTARTSGTTGAMATALQGRLRSLALAHDLIRPAIRLEIDQAQIGEISFQQLLTTLLSPHMAEGAGAQLQLSGSYVPLGPNAATQFSLVLHELATNAGKYGCFSTPTGCLSLTWTIADEMLKFTWAERGGPKIDAPPKHKGFGSQLVRMALNAQLRGKVAYEWRQDGVHVDCLIPIASLKH